MTDEQKKNSIHKGFMFAVFFLLLVPLVLPIGCVLGAIEGACRGMCEGAKSAVDTLSGILLKLRWGKDYEPD